MTAQNQLRMHSIAKHFCPLRIAFHFDTEWAIPRRIFFIGNMCKWYMRNNQPVINPRRCIGVGRIGDFIAKIRGFARTERFAANGSAIFWVIVPFVLGAIQQIAPNAPYSENRNTIFRFRSAYIPPDFRRTHRVNRGFPVKKSQGFGRPSQAMQFGMQGKYAQYCHYDLQYLRSGSANRAHHQNIAQPPRTLQRCRACRQADRYEYFLAFSPAEMNIRAQPVLPFSENMACDQWICDTQPCTIPPHPAPPSEQ